MIYTFVVSFILGIAFESVWGGGWTVGLLVLVSSLAVSLVIWKNDTRLSRVFLIIGVGLFLGVMRMSMVDTAPDPNLFKSVNQKISFEAVISDEADIRDTSARYIVTVNQNSLSGDSLECLARLDGGSTRNF